MVKLADIRKYEEVVIFKKGKRLIAVALAGFVMMASTPATAGLVVFYYYDYVGGTPAGYAIYCSDGRLIASGGVTTNILIYNYQDTGC